MGKEGKTVFLLTAKRDTAAIDAINAKREMTIVVHQIKDLHNIAEQDCRIVKRVTRPMLCFRFFRVTKNILAGTELMHMIRKGQIMMKGADEMFFADQFYALVV
ncbi:DDE domain protein [Collimonas fungivorans]|uniref:DDE domain protein n=1 Tax=Collimonas fungivorans TaxID=158899 RepID=A0A127P696_9BURK|nr:DDE domain protein [Collimonas fungivorans]